MPRPSIAVIVPFRGPPRAAEDLRASLRRVEVEPGDEVIVVDNRGEEAFDALGAGDIGVVVAAAEHSSYYARNAGAERASAPWLLFLDADCHPVPRILDEYFVTTPADRCGVIAGGVRPSPGQQSLAARYASARKHLDEGFHLRAKPFAAGITANLLVRSATWRSLGGFHEGVRSGADVEFCWRAQEAGWQLEHRPSAAVEHVHPETVRELLRKSARYGAGRRWVNRRFRGSMPRPRLARPLARSLVGGLGWPLAGQPRRGAYKLLDGAYVAAGAWGYLTGDVRAYREPAAAAGRGRSVVISTDAFPARSETFVYNEALALGDLGWSVRVEAAARPVRVERAVARRLTIDYVEDYWPPQALRDLAWLLARHPLRCARDVSARGHWREQEEVPPLRAIASGARRLTRAGRPHTHVHFAAGAALTAMRLHLLLGSRYSVIGHGYDVFQKRRNLVEKLERAAFVVAPCEYTAEHLRGLVPDRAATDVHVVLMGVDGERFKRQTRYPGGATVTAVGRLVEKKGFAYLVTAAAELQRRGRLERLVIAGAGPLRHDLEALAARNGLGDAFEIVEAWGADEIRELLERADVLALPSVIASDGDRDAMPMVVKEALAMEIPVATSDQVGLPELVRPEWGRMVPPRDADALAGGIAELLDRTRAEREEMGAAGRRFVLNHCALESEARKLALLLSERHAGVAGPPAP